MIENTLVDVKAVDPRSDSNNAEILAVVDRLNTKKRTFQINDIRYQFLVRYVPIDQNWWLPQCVCHKRQQLVRNGHGLIWDKKSNRRNFSHTHRTNSHGVFILHTDKYHALYSQNAHLQCQCIKNVYPKNMLHIPRKETYSWMK